MLNNESWLAHSELFEKYWVIETKPWVRSLGWFTDFIETVKDAQGWAQAGDKELTVFDYVDIIDAPLAQKKLYRCLNGVTWEHISGPVVFVVRKDDEQVFIAGWAGERKLIEKQKKISSDPWEWTDKMIVEVDPIVALHTLKVRRTSKKDQVPVFFASNGESNADDNWEHLVKLCPRAVRIDGINGRRNMFHKCVDLSDNAKQFFVVTGKNYVTDASVFDYPVETISDAHVIFQAKNMSNRLQYGHMGIVCYNSNLVLNTPENFGLDFTQYSKNITVPRTVSEATFATTPYEAWRTAFREVVKLTLQYTSDSHLWLERWLAFAEGQNSDWVMKGAKDGYEYAEQYRDNKEALNKTVDWNWLENYFKEQYES
jgi:hypothetical protein